MPAIANGTIRQAAVEVGIDLVGFARAAPMEDARRGIEDCIEAGLVPKDTDWKTEDPSAFCDPRSVLLSARCVVVAAQCCLADEPDDLSRPGEPHGLIARYTRRNHYRDLRDRLKKLSLALGKVCGAAPRSKCLSCGPLAEKPLAREAGLGWYGKHGIVITLEFGSWVVLGELVTELEIEPDSPMPERCGDCSACIKACPTGAIKAPGRLDRSRCIQHLTNSPHPIPHEWRTAWGKRLYGCTACQEACPMNARVRPTGLRVAVGVVGPSIPLLPLLKMSEAEYGARYPDNQISARWVRFDCIKRNACLALGNAGDPAAVDPLTEALRSDPSPLVRGHAAWALGKLDDGRTRSALDRALGQETDAGVRDEVSSALD